MLVVRQILIGMKFIIMVWSLQARVSLKRIGDFLQNKDIDKDNVLRYPFDEETGNLTFSVVYFFDKTLAPKYLQTNNLKYILFTSRDVV